MAPSWTTQSSPGGKPLVGHGLCPGPTQAAVGARPSRWRRGQSFGAPGAAQLRQSCPSSQMRPEELCAAQGGGCPQHGALDRLCGRPLCGWSCCVLTAGQRPAGPLPWEVCGEGGQPAPCRNVFRMTQCGDAQHPLCAHGGPVLLRIEASWGGCPARARQGPDTRCRL